MLAGVWLPLPPKGCLLPSLNQPYEPGSQGCYLLLTGGVSQLKSCLDAQSVLFFIALFTPICLRVFFFVSISQSSSWLAVHIMVR